MLATTTDPRRLIRGRETGREWFIRRVLGFFTYGIVAAAGFILLHILYHGAPVVFKSEAPFINLEFLTGQPQTLHVYEPRELADSLRVIRLDILEAESSFGAAPKAELRAKKAEQRQLEEQLRSERLLYSDSKLRELDQPPDEAAYIYSNYAYSAGGIGPAIVGTFLLVAGSIVIAMALGISSAIYLSEYSRPGLLLTIIRISVLNLSGVPSIVFGLFGFGIFVLFFGWGVSLIAGWFTLAIMALPVIIASSEEALQAVPDEYRQGSLGLGASKWTTIRTNVLPYALPGILSSSIMGIARVAGETAPILFTAAFALRDQFPWEGIEKPGDFFFQGVMALPYHIYLLSSKVPVNEYTHNVQYGSVFVFVSIIGFFALASILLRQRLRVEHNRDNARHV